jgi:glycosyltransferase involved in cell wall biosynthesis
VSQDLNQADRDVAVSVVVPARDAARTLEATLSALAAQELDEAFELIVVDDGSRDETPEIASRHAGLVQVIRREKSRGPGPARNCGAAIARAPILAFTDADCVPVPQWLARGLEALAGADLVQGRVVPDPSARRTPFDRSLAVSREGGFYQTANLFVRRETFEAVGGFTDWSIELRPHRLSPGLWRRNATRVTIGEDALFAWTARRLGARSAYAPEALVHHEVRPMALSAAVADRWRWSREMPGLAKLVPELRRSTFYRGVFFNHVSARFDLALAGLAMAAASRRMAWSLTAVPYGRHLVRAARQWEGGEALTYLLGAPLVDAVTLVGLLTGSVTWRSLTL